MAALQVGRQGCSSLLARVGAEAVDRLVHWAQGCRVDRAGDSGYMRQEARQGVDGAAMSALMCSCCVDRGGCHEDEAPGIELGPDGIIAQNLCLEFRACALAA